MPRDFCFVLHRGLQMSHRPSGREIREPVTADCEDGDWILRIQQCKITYALLMDESLGLENACLPRHLG